MIADGGVAAFALRSFTVAQSLGTGAMVDSSHRILVGLPESRELLVAKLTLGGGVVLYRVDFAAQPAG